MQRRSSGSSEDSADVPVKTSRPQGQTRLNDANSSIRHSHDVRQSNHHHHQNSGTRSTSARSRRPSSNINWRPSHSRDGSTEKPPIATASHLAPATLSPDCPIDSPIDSEKTSRSRWKNRQPQPWNPWAMSFLTLFTSTLGISLLITVLYSAVTLHCDPKGCRMSWMSPSYAKFSDFDTEHTRFATKYSLYLYREQGFDNGPKVWISHKTIFFEASVDLIYRLKVYRCYSYREMLAVINRLDLLRLNQLDISTMSFSTIRML